MNDMKKILVQLVSILLLSACGNDPGITADVENLGNEKIYI